MFFIPQYEPFYMKSTLFCEIFYCISFTFLCLFLTNQQCYDTYYVKDISSLHSNERSLSWQHKMMSLSRRNQHLINKYKRKSLKNRKGITISGNYHMYVTKWIPHLLCGYTIRGNVVTTRNISLSYLYIDCFHITCNFTVDKL